jgi:hypothetical protein
VVELLTDSEKRQTMSAAARESAETRFCTTRIIPRYESYYEEILAGSRVPA